MLPQDSELQLKRGRVTITQSVPNGKWFLVPTPAIKVRFLYLPSLCVTTCWRWQVLGLSKPS